MRFHLMRKKVKIIIKFKTDTFILKYPSIKSVIESKIYKINLKDRKIPNPLNFKTNKIAF